MEGRGRETFLLQTPTTLARLLSFAFTPRPQAFSWRSAASEERHVRRPRATSALRSRPRPPALTLSARGSEEFLADNLVGSGSTEASPQGVGAGKPSACLEGRGGPGQREGRRGTVGRTEAFYFGPAVTRVGGYQLMPARARLEKPAVGPSSLPR